jgi:hypothetical protein
VAEVVGIATFKVTTADGAEEVQGDHWLIAAGCLVVRSPGGNDLRCWAAGCWSRVELVG